MAVLVSVFIGPTLHPILYELCIHFIYSKCRRTVSPVVGLAWKSSSSYRNTGVLYFSSSVCVGGMQSNLYTCVTVWQSISIVLDYTNGELQAQLDLQSSWGTIAGLILQGLSARLAMVTGQHFFRFKSSKCDSHRVLLHILHNLFPFIFACTIPLPALPRHYIRWCFFSFEDVIWLRHVELNTQDRCLFCSGLWQTLGIL